MAPHKINNINVFNQIDGKKSIKKSRSTLISNIKKNFDKILKPKLKLKSVQSEGDVTASVKVRCLRIRRIKSAIEQNFDTVNKVIPRCSQNNLIRKGKCDLALRRNKINKGKRVIKYETIYNDEEITEKVDMEGPCFDPVATITKQFGHL